MAKSLFRAFSHLKRTMPNIPDRWDKYCALGKVIQGTRFLPFKVPLKESYLTNVEQKDKFSPVILTEMLGEQGLKLGVVIDLTFTHKYYNKEEFISKFIDHKKILTRGHEVPSQDIYDDFAETVKVHDGNDHLIGVHCTHGVNRTGYLICRYMIEEMDMDPDTAISLFNEARGHDLERPNYLNDLKSRKRGESSYVPNRMGQVCVNSKDEFAPAPSKKARWRHHKEDHPGWRQKTGPQHVDQFQNSVQYDNTAMEPSQDPVPVRHSAGYRSRGYHRYEQYKQNCDRRNLQGRSSHGNDRQYHSYGSGNRRDFHHMSRFDNHNNCDELYHNSTSARRNHQGYDDSFRGRDNNTGYTWRNPGPSGRQARLDGYRGYWNGNEKAGENMRNDDSIKDNNGDNYHGWRYVQRSRGRRRPEVPQMYKH